MVLNTHHNFERRFGVQHHDQTNRAGASDELYLVVVVTVLIAPKVSYQRAAPPS